MSSVKFDIFARDRASKTFDNVRKKAGGLRDGLGKVKGIVGGLVVAAAGLAIFNKVAGFFGDSIKAASDLEESVNKVSVVFGAAGKDVRSFAKSAAKNLGLSEQAALEAASAFGNMFRTTGLARGASAKMSRTMVRLATDMASFNNEDPSDMLDRLRSGLAGEAEPLRRFGVLLSEARVKAFAYKNGIAEVGATLTEAQKVQARYGLILKDTALQQGDFANTSQSLANQQRILTAQFEDLKAVVGSKVVPVLTELFLAATGSKGLPAITKWVDKLKPEDVARFFAIAAKAVLNFARIGVLQMQLLSNAWFLLIEGILTGASKLPFVGETFRKSMRNAAKSVRDFGSKTDEVFDNIIGAIDSGKEAVDRFPKIVKLGGDIKDLKAKITDAEARLKATTDKKRRAEIKGEISDLKTKLAEAQRRIKALRGKTINIGANTSGARKKLKAIKGLIASVKGKKVIITVEAKSVSGDLGDILGRGTKKEHGGRVRKNQLLIVGEKRAEVFVPDSNGTILPRVPTAGSGGRPVPLQRAAGPQTVRVELVLRGDGTRRADFLIDELIHSLRARGRSEAVRVLRGAA